MAAALGLALLAALALAAALLRLVWQKRRLREQLRRATGQLERLERDFARFAPAEIVDRVIAAGAVVGGDRREVTALFADLVGSTALAQSLPPATLLLVLNGYFERMSRAITEHHGHLSTLIGDGILALFGALDQNPWQCHDACRAALAMRRELADYNQHLAGRGLPALACGIGLHRGLGVAGLVGSRDLLQFTVVGITVSVAARLQQATREHEADILLTAAVREHLDERFALAAAGALPLRGIARPVLTWALLRAGESGAEERGSEKRGDSGRGDAEE